MMFIMPFASFLKMVLCLKKSITLSLLFFLRLNRLHVLMIIGLYHVVTSCLNALAKVLLTVLNSVWSILLVRINQLLCQVEVLRIIFFWLMSLCTIILWTGVLLDVRLKLIFKRRTIRLIGTFCAWFCMVLGFMTKWFRG